MSRRTLLHATATASCLAVVLSTAPAFAQTCPSVSLSVDSVAPRYHGHGDTSANLYPIRPACENPGWIDLQDCESDARIQFTLLESGLPCTDTVQVWAGTVDCTQVSARQANSGATHCWEVTPPGAFATVASSTADIRAEDIVGFLGNPSPPTVYAPRDVTACDAMAKLSRDVHLGIYFMAVEADGMTVDGTSAVYELGAMPNPPDGGTCAAPGDGGTPDAGTPPGAGAPDAGSVIGGCAVADGSARGGGWETFGALVVALVAMRAGRARFAARPCHGPSRPSKPTRPSAG